MLNNSEHHGCGCSRMKEEMKRQADKLVSTRFGPERKGLGLRATWNWPAVCWTGRP